MLVSIRQLDVRLFFLSITDLPLTKSFNANGTIFAVDRRPMPADDQLKQTLTRPIALMIVKNDRAPFKSSLG